MGREICSMMVYLQGEYYCDYYDIGFKKCHEVAHCPDGLDDDLDGDLDNEDFDD